MKRIIEYMIITAVFVVMAAISGCNLKKDNEQSSDTKEVVVQQQTVDTAAIVAAVMKKMEEKEEATEEPSPQPQQERSSMTPVYMGLWGNIGGTTFNFDMNGTTGSYIPYDMSLGKEYGVRRQLKLVSYNPKTGRCIINAFMNGSNIGQFEGIFEEDEVNMGGGESKKMQAYNGYFKSVKGGKLKFYLYFD